MPSPPEGQGPVLEWFQSSKRGAVYAGASMFLLLIGFLTLKDWGIGWARVWWLWLIIVVGSLLIFLGIRGGHMSAGADWFKHNRSWVKIYELVSIRVTKAWASDELEFKDASGRKASASFMTIQRNLELWDLVYNGILHSVCTGRARTNQLARERLKLPEGIPVEGEDTQPPGRVGKAGRAMHIVLMILLAIPGSLALAFAAGFAVSGDFFNVGGVIIMAFLALIGAGFICGYVLLKRRLER